MTARRYVESPALIRSGDEELYGILVTPTEPTRAVTVVHVNGKGPTASTVGRGRISVLLTRSFAERGFHGFRLDWRGSGESTGRERDWTLTDLPSVEMADAVDWLESQGLGDVVLVGTCGGARAVLEAAAHLPESSPVRGVGLLNMPVRDYDKDKRFESMPLRQMARRLLRRQTLVDMRDSGRRRRYLARARRKLTFLFKGSRGSGDGAASQAQAAGPRMVRALEVLADRKIPVLVFYGQNDDDHHDWVAASGGPLGHLLAGDHPPVVVRVIPGRYYDRSSRELNEDVVQAIEEDLLRASDDRVRTA